MIRAIFAANATTAMFGWARSPIKTISGAMEALQVELLFGLELDEPHRWSRRGFSNCLSVTVVILLRLDVGPDIFRRHEANDMTLPSQHAAEMMSAAARFHGDNAPRKLCGQFRNAVAVQSPAQKDLTGRIDPCHAAAILAEVDSQQCDLHNPSLSRLILRHCAGGWVGEPFHKHCWPASKIARISARRGKPG